MNRTITAILTALCATTLAACATTDTATKASSPPAAAATITPAVEETTPSPTPTDSTLALTDTATYTSNIEVSLSGFKRGVSSDVAAPANTAYLKFKVKIVNGSGATIDLNEMYVNCQYGDTGQTSDQIFDDGLDGTPTTHLRPGRSISALVACALPKGEHYLQVEITPDMQSEAAIFAGDIK